MEPITQFTPAVLKALRPEIDAALKAVADKYGVTFHAGNGLYSGVEASFKLEMKVADTTAVEAEERRTFEKHCRIVGLEPEDFGKRFRASNYWYTVIGFDPGRPKFCIKVRDEKTGKTVGMTDLVVPTIRATAKVA